MSSFCKADWGKNASKCLKLTEYDKTLKSATLLHLNAAAVYSCAIVLSFTSLGSFEYLPWPELI